MRKLDFLQTQRIRKAQNYRYYIGIVTMIFSIILMVAFVKYMHKHWSDYKLIDPNILYLNPKREQQWLLSLAQFFFDKLGLSSWFLCGLLIVYSLNRIIGGRVFRFKRYFFRILLLIFYSNLLTGFLMPRYRFPYSGALGKVIAVWCMGVLGLWLTMLLVFLVLPYLIFKLWRQGII